MYCVKFYQLSVVLVSILLGGGSGFAMQKEEKINEKSIPSSQSKESALGSDNFQNLAQEFLPVIVDGTSSGDFNCCEHLNHYHGRELAEEVLANETQKGGVSRSIINLMDWNLDKYALSLWGPIDEQDISILEKLEKMEEALWQGFNGGNFMNLVFLALIADNYLNMAKVNNNELTKRILTKNSLHLHRKIYDSFAAKNFPTMKLSNEDKAKLKKIRVDSAVMTALFYMEGLETDINYKEGKRLFLEAARSGSIAALTSLVTIVSDDPRQPYIKDFFEYSGSTKEELLKDIGKIFGEMFKDISLPFTDTFLKICDLDSSIGTALYVNQDAWKADSEMREYGEAFFQRLLRSSPYEISLINFIEFEEEKAAIEMAVQHLKVLAQDYHDGLHQVPKDRKKSFAIHQALFDILNPIVENAKLIQCQKEKIINDRYVFLKNLCLTDEHPILDSNYFQKQGEYVKKFITICKAQDLSSISALLQGHTVHPNQSYSNLLDFNNLIMDRLDSVLVNIKKISEEDQKAFDHIRNVFQHLFDFQIKNLKNMDMSPENIKKYFSVFEITLKKAQLFLNTKNLGKAYDEKNENSLKDLYVSTTIDVLNILKDNLQAVQNLTNQPKKKKDLIKIYQNAFDFLKESKLKTYPKAQKHAFKKAIKEVESAFQPTAEEKTSDAKSVFVSSASTQGAIPQAAGNDITNAESKPKPIEKQIAKPEREYKEKKPAVVKPKVPGGRSVASVQSSKELPKSPSKTIVETPKLPRTVRVPNLKLQNSTVRGSPKYEPKNSPQIFQNEKVMDKLKISEEAPTQLQEKETPKSSKFESNVVPTQEKLQEAGTQALKAEEQEVYVKGVFIENPSLVAQQTHGQHRALSNGDLTQFFGSAPIRPVQMPARRFPLEPSVTLPLSQYQAMHRTIDALAWERDQILYQQSQYINHLHIAEDHKREIFRLLVSAITDRAAAIQGLRALNMSDDIIKHLLDFGAKELDKKKKDR